MRPSFTLLSQNPPIRAFVNLPRTLISISGSDSSKFLNGLITNKIDNCNGVYAGFLNSKGRVLADTFIHRADKFIPGNDASYIIECDVTEGNLLLKMLKTYKLRAKVNIALLDDNHFKVFSLWDESAASQRSFPLSMTNPLVIDPNTKHVIGLDDSRAPGFGLRLIINNCIENPAQILTDKFLSIGDLAQASLDQYKTRRILYGIPEGAQEIIPEHSLPLDSCMDYMGGIDFNKGCYLGQELTIRSHHHGIVRKRVIPVTLGETTDLVYDEDVNLGVDPSDLIGASIMAVDDTATITRGKQRSSGTILSISKNIGLALVRLEHFAKPEARFYIPINNSGICIRGYVPFWWP